MRHDDFINTHQVRLYKLKLNFWETFKYHVNMRLKNRGILREAVVSSVSEYEIIEEYPDDRYFPSYLVYSRYRNTVFHVLFAADAEGGDVRVITAYIPDSDQWKDDLKTRR